MPRKVFSLSLRWEAQARSEGSLETVHHTMFIRCHPGAHSPVGAGATGTCMGHQDAKFWEVEGADLQRIRRRWPDPDGDSETGIPGRGHGAGKTRREEHPEA